MPDNVTLHKKDDKNKTSEKAELTHDKPLYIPKTDIYEKDNSIYVVCDMPGVNEKNIDISLENDVLTITGYQEEENYDNYELIQRSYESGIYQRYFTI